jgi:glycosyltransferase involved in cell wall biosynthesis
MKILFVDRLGAHAIWSLIDLIAARLMDRKDQVFYCRLDDGRQREPLPLPAGVKGIDVKVPRIGMAGFRNIIQTAAFCREFVRILNQIAPDVVHTHFAFPSIPARAVAHAVGIPIILSTQHELCESMRWYLKRGLRLTERYTDAVVYVSRAGARSFGHADLVNSGERTQHRVIPNGVDVEAIRMVSSGVNRRIPGKLVCAGRMVAVKGQETLVRALPRVIAAHPQTRLTLVGAGPDESRLRGLVHDLGLNEHVRFTGWLLREDTLREMATAQAVVVPSTQEGFGLALIEAILCETPVIASDIPVFREVIGTADDAVHWFPPENVEILANALITAFNTDSVDLNGSATSARHKAEGDYNFARMTAAYLDLYDDLLRRKSKGGN